MAPGISLKLDEIHAALEDDVLRKGFPPILNVEGAARLLGFTSKSTIYEWAAKGRLDGAFRKRGKHLLFWRDRLITCVFNGPEWPKESTND